MRRHGEPDPRGGIIAHVSRDATETLATIGGAMIIDQKMGHAASPTARDRALHHRPFLGERALMTARRSALVAAVVALLAPPAPGPSAAEGPAGATLSGTLVVLAAASLADACRAAGAEFVRLHAGVDVTCSAAASSTLLRQIEEGAHGDVIATADEASMDALAAAGRLDGAAAIFARNTLVIAVAPGNPKRIASIRDLARADVSLALCARTVPAGRYAAQAFAAAGLSPPPASEELDVRAVLTRVTLGEVDAGIVYKTDIGAAGGSAEGIAIGEAADVVARYPVAALAEASNRAAARAFVAFLLSPSGQATLARFGFLPP